MKVKLGFHFLTLFHKSSARNAAFSKLPEKLEQKANQAAGHAARRLVPLCIFE